MFRPAQQWTNMMAENWGRLKWVMTPVIIRVVKANVSSQEYEFNPLIRGLQDFTVHKYIGICGAPLRERADFSEKYQADHGGPPRERYRRRGKSTCAQREGQYLVYGSRPRCLRLFRFEKSIFISHGDCPCALVDGLHFARALLSNKTVVEGH